HFTPSNMILMVAGGMPVRTYRKLIREYFERDVPGENGWIENPVRDTQCVVNDEERIVSADFNHVFVSTGYYLPIPQSLDFPSREVSALQLAGYSLAKRIFNDIRDKQGLAYSAYSGMTGMRHGYYFQLYGEFSKDHYKKGRTELEKYTQNL